MSNKGLHGHGGEEQRSGGVAGGHRNAFGFGSVRFGSVRFGSVRAHARVGVCVCVRLCVCVYWKYLGVMGACGIASASIEPCACVRQAMQDAYRGA